MTATRVGDKLRVLVGPLGLCHRYARAFGLTQEQYLAVDGAAQLGCIDPSHVRSVTFVRPHNLPRQTVVDIRELVKGWQALWDIPIR
jgi:hypothetical protein